MAVLIGETHGHLGQTALLQEVFNRSDGDAPKVNLEVEKKHGNFILENRELINACIDLSDGGLALAAFELAHRSEIGFEIYEESTEFLFAEDQARYLIACEFDQAEELYLLKQVNKIFLFRQLVVSKVMQLFLGIRDPS